MKRSEVEREFQAGDQILERGAVVPELFVVHAGTVVLDWHDGSPPLMLGKGAPFGSLGALVGEASPYEARAESDGVLLALNGSALNELCRTCSEFPIRLARHLGEALTQARNAARAVPAGPAGITELVPVLLARRVGSDRPAPIQGRLEDLATAAGLPAIAAYRCVQALLDQRLLRLVEDQLALVDPDALQRLAAG
jgi:CRP-like cAMP-binding protein